MSDARTPDVPASSFEGAALVEGAHDLVWVTGADAVSFLQGLLSQDVEATPPGKVARSLLLGPQGKLRALLWVLRGEGRVGILSDRGLGSRVAEDLAHYRIRVKADISLDTRPSFEVWGSGAGELAGVEEASWTEREGALVAAVPLATMPRVVVVGGPAAPLQAAGATRVTAESVTALRVEAGEPVMGRDVDESTIPQETGLVAEAVSFSKGCYLGQELVARIDSRGHVNRHLRGVVLAGDPPPEGAGVWVGEREAGRLTSPAPSARLGGTVGLALLRRGVEPGTAADVRWEGGGAPGTVHSLPMPAVRRDGGAGGE